MGALSWRGSFLVAVVFALGWLTFGSRLPRGISWAQTLADTPPTLTPALAVVGTYGCSARTCHGGLEPLRGSGVLQNEYTTWILHDKHADAYRVLFNERSRTIARNLGGKAPAHEDIRCLACHTHPLTATVVERTPAVLEERLSGVGCESCHGEAKNWFKPHTRPDWKQLPPDQKRAQGMVPVADLATRVQTCAGCHVGAAPDKEGRPLRDVNHDLIAAGHPRLSFEFGAFQANMPAHWIEKEEAKKPAYASKAWAIGQLASAEAALKLLNYRAHTREQPWPEFAEYDCFACHHSLYEPSNRQQRGYGDRRPGSFPWGTWYFTLPHALATPAADGDAQVRAGLDDLAKLMRQPYPDRQQVADRASRGAAQLESWLQKVDRTGFDGAKLLKFLASDPKLAEASWDSAAQLYLGLFALEPRSTDAERLTVLRDLSQKQAFPALKDSPSDPRSQDFRAALRKWLEQNRQ